MTRSKGEKTQAEKDVEALTLIATHYPTDADEEGFRLIQRRLDEAIERMVAEKTASKKKNLTPSLSRRSPRDLA